MIELPLIELKEERQALIVFMSRPFYQDADYKRTKETVTAFVNRMETREVLECLAMINPRHETLEGRESRLRYFEQHKEFILETLHYDSAGDGLSEENKLRLTDAYLDIESEEYKSG